MSSRRRIPRYVRGNNNNDTSIAAAATPKDPNTIREEQAKKDVEKNNQEPTEKVLIADDDFKMRATVRQEPKKDKYGNYLDAEGNINKSRGKIGIMSNQNVNKETGNPLSVEDIKAKQAEEQANQQKQIKLQQEQQKMLRYEMQGRLNEYKPPAEFAQEPLLQHPNKMLQKPKAEQVVDTNKGEVVINNQQEGQTAEQIQQASAATQTQEQTTSGGQGQQQVDNASRVTDNNTQQQ